MKKTFCDVCEKETVKVFIIRMYGGGEFDPHGTFEVCKECCQKIYDILKKEQQNEKV